MEIQLNRLRQLSTQQYSPRQSEPGREPLGRFSTRAFDNGRLAALFHENTKYRSYDSPRIGASISTFLTDDAVQFASAKVDPDYTGRTKVALPDPAPIDVPLGEALEERRSVREFAGDGLTKRKLATLLARSFGITGGQVVGVEPEGERTIEQSFRAYPSGGGLYPTEQYVVLPNETEDLAAGCYHYSPRNHHLRVIERAGDGFQERLTDLVQDTDIVDIREAAAFVVVTGVFWRSKAKYGERGYRHVLLEAGHAGQNLLLVATAMGLGATPFDGIEDAAIDEFLDVDGVEESVVYSLVIGHEEGETDV